MIPVHEPCLDGNELAYVQECVRTGWISSEGSFVRRFEDAMCKRFGMPEGVAVCNGTAALEVALYALNLRVGAEVIMPSFTIISCALACVRLGLVPVLVDIDAETWTMDPGQIEARITSKTGAIMPVHIYGNPVDMDPVLAIARRHGLAIVEDFAEAHGAGYRSGATGGTLRCGAMGDVAATSFYANKLITCGEGGMVLCKTRGQADRARSYRNLCFDKDRRFVHEDLGFNYRMTNLQAAIGLGQLERLERTVAQKREIAAWYRQTFASMLELRFHPVPSYSEPVYWMYCIELRTESGCDAEVLAAGLRERGIGTRFFFRGMHCQPALLKLGLFAGEQYRRTEFATRYGLYLPSSLSLTVENIGTIGRAVQDILSAGKGRNRVGAGKE